MDGRVVIYKKDIQLKSYDADKRDKYYVKKENNVYKIIDKKTQEVVSAASTSEETEEFFYEESKVVDTWSLLRNSVSLSGTITIRDLITIINDNVSLLALTTTLFPYFFLYEDEIADNDFISSEKELILSRNILIENDFLKTKSCFNAGLITNLDTPLKLEETTTFQLNGQTVTATFGYSLLEVLIYLFGDESNDHVILTKNGLIDSWDNEPTDDPMSFLMQPCKLEDGLTLLDLMNFVRDNNEITNFISCYSWCQDIDAFHEQLNMPYQADKLIKKLEINCHANMFKYKMKHPEFNIYYDVIGFGDVEEEFLHLYKEENPQANYSISYTPLYEISNLPITINNELKIFNTPKYELIYTYKYQPTLLEILDAIYWDISFVGGPEERVEFLEGLKEKVDGLEGKEFSDIKDIIEENLDDLDKEIWDDFLGDK